MNTETELLYIGFRALSTCCVCAAFLMITSCGDNVVSLRSPEPGGGDMISATVSQVEGDSYMESHINTPDTTGRKTPVDEWVPAKEPPTDRAVPAAVPYKGSLVVRTTLREESQTTTCVATSGNGIYFRLIAFRKVGSNYVFQSVADFATNGASAPALRQEKLPTRAGTVRMIGYSFNSTTVTGTIPSTYIYNGASVTIPNMSNDFMVCDSGNITNVSIISHNLSANLTRKLRRLTVKLSLSQFINNTPTNCIGIYASQDGNASAWTIDPSTNSVSVNTGNTSIFNIVNNPTVTARLIPFSGSRAITAHIDTLTLSNYSNADSRGVTSSQGVQSLPGKSYITTLKFELGVQSVASDINLTQDGCTMSDKDNLTKLGWATGNLKNIGNTNYAWTIATDRGYYYTFYSIYTGNTNTDNTDSCSKLNTVYYGTGWCTPSRNTLAVLSRCMNKALTNRGTWFMNSGVGFFLSAAGYRSDNRGGNGTETITDSDTEGYHQSKDDAGGTVSYFVLLRNRTTEIQAYQKKNDKTVCCVKGD